MTLILETVKVEPLSLATQPVADHKALDRVAFDFAQSLAGGLDSRLSLTKDAVSAEIITAAGLRDIISPEHAYVAYRMVPFKATVVVALPLPLIRLLVDLDYGGDGSAVAESGILSPSEQRFFERLETHLASVLVDIWQQASSADVSAIRLDIGAGLPMAFTGDQPLALHRFGFTIGKAKPLTAVLMMPTAMARHVNAQAAMASPVEDSIDPLWTKSFAKAVMQTRLPVRTIFAQPEVPVSQLLSLKPGDVIPLRLTDRLPVIAGDCRFAEGSLGEANGRAAIQIQRTLEGIPTS
jgi:flagellar motor switch protein FliM